MPVMFPPTEAADVAAVRDAARALQRALNATVAYGYRFDVNVEPFEILQ